MIAWHLHFIDPIDHYLVPIDGSISVVGWDAVWEEWNWRVKKVNTELGNEAQVGYI